MIAAAVALSAQLVRVDELARVAAEQRVAALEQPYRSAPDPRLRRQRDDARVALRVILEREALRRLLQQQP